MLCAGPIFSPHADVFISFISHVQRFGIQETEKAENPNEYQFGIVLVEQLNVCLNKFLEFFGTDLYIESEQ